MASEREVLEKVRALVDRALDDPELESRLAEDPWTTAKEFGLARDETAAALELEPSASDAEIAEALRERVVRTEWGRGLPEEILDAIP